ncbi:unnamed protein product [Chrysoparadoxa australica]
MRAIGGLAALGALGLGFPSVASFGFGAGPVCARPRGPTSIRDGLGRGRCERRGGKGLSMQAIEDEPELNGLAGEGVNGELPEMEDMLMTPEEEEAIAEDGILPIELEAELRSSFMQYAMSVILGRALPDARDGLKPVHRRILYAMHGLNLSPEGGYRKCARVVGEVLGKYHPHGDVAVYDALVRMAQDFVMGAPLVAGHGNFGSVDNDPAAAMRYTESKLSHIARDALLSDINLDTVDFQPNFDGNEEEPLVLPARLPMVLLNGASGIAVGMATNIPPHNLGELVSATIALIRDPELPDDTLLKLVPAPDFPTGGRIMGLSGSRKLYTTSNGGISVRATTHIESISARGRAVRNAIVVTQIPYMVNKSMLLEKIANLVNDKKLDGVADLRDESDREGVRVVIELKRDAVPQVVENNLFKKTPLQNTFSGNMLALGKDGTQPQRFTLRGALNAFIEFRFRTVRRRCMYELSKVKAREHLVEGLIIALEKVDEVIAVVRSCSDNAAAKAALTGDAFNLSQEQAEAILGLRLGRLTSMEEGKLRSELEDLKANVERLNGLMEHDDRINDTIVQELEEIKQKHAVPRRTLIQTDDGELSDMDLVENERSLIVVTSAGYIKRMPLEEFQAQNRGTRGKAGAKLSEEEDHVVHFVTCQDHDTLLFVSDRGVAYALRAFQVPLGSRVAKGVPVPQVLPLSAEEHISSIIPVSKFVDNEYLVLLTKRGWIKKTPLAAFSSLTARGLIVINLDEGDELQWVKVCTENDSIIIGTEQGYAMRFLSDNSQLRPTGRTSRGVKALKYRPNDVPVDMDVLPQADGDEKTLLIMTAQGIGKRVKAKEFRVQKRGGLGVIALKFKKRDDVDDRLACFKLVDEDAEVMLSTMNGTIVRQRAAQIATQSRPATGVKVQRLDATDLISSVAVVPVAIAGEDDDTGKYCHLCGTSAFASSLTPLT